MRTWDHYTSMTIKCRVFLAFSRGQPSPDLHQDTKVTSLGEKHHYDPPRKAFQIQNIKTNKIYIKKVMKVIWVYFICSHKAMSFKLGHINILFHAFPDCCAALSFHILVFSSQAYTYSKQAIFLWQLFVCKVRERGRPCHCSRTLLFAEAAVFGPGLVKDTLSGDSLLFPAIHSK